MRSPTKPSVPYMSTSCTAITTQKTGNGKGSDCVSRGKDGRISGTVDAAAIANAVERIGADFKSSCQRTTSVLQWSEQGPTGRGGGDLFGNFTTHEKGHPAPPLRRRWAVIASDTLASSPIALRRFLPCLPETPYRV